MRRALALLTATVAVAGCSSALNRPVVPPMSDPGLPQIQQGEPAPAPMVMQYAPPLGPPAPAAMLADPLRVPVADRDFAWDQLVAVVEEYFKVEHEERVKLIGDLLTEGRIDTFPVTGATLLEPWRGDSVTNYDRLEATLQSIRRRCFVRVIPEAASYLVDVQVFKELEDLPRPSMSTAGAATFNTSAADDRGAQPLPSYSETAGGPRVPRPVNWIPQGRDTNLEQLMLAKIQARLAIATAPPTFGPAPIYSAPPGTAPVPSPLPPPAETIPRPQ
jgi:hypothetical protein